MKRHINISGKLHLFSSPYCLKKPLPCGRGFFFLYSVASEEIAERL
ncbi:hypothetical protein B4143_2909 [Bacillus subtilis]|nr:hypothetical protein B4143_2909 [Bacillus subtilis]